MDDYFNGIVYATGHIVSDEGKQYLVVRNTDPWYIDYVSSKIQYKKYKSGYYEKNRNRDQWVVKVRNISEIVDLSDIQSISDFCRAYIEIHGVLDLAKYGKDKRKLRLRIFGKEQIIQYMNKNLPAKEKKIQYIKNMVADKYVGRTCAIYYQSQKEVEDILKFIDGYPKNNKIWERWESLLSR